MLPLPITGLNANTAYSYQFEVGNASDGIVWTSEPFKFRTAQTLGSAAPTKFAVEGCHGQVAFCHPFRDTQHTVAAMQAGGLFTIHGGDAGYEQGLTANIATYMRANPPLDRAGFKRVLQDFFSDYDLYALCREASYLMMYDDHAVVNNVDSTAFGSSVLAETFADGKSIDPGWGTATLGELATAGLAVQDAWSLHHDNLPPDEANGQPARYWAQGSGEVEFLFIDSRWTRTESANEQVSAQQLAYIQARIDALQSTTKILVIITQTPITNFTAKSGDSWEGVASAQYSTFMNYVNDNMPVGCQALLLCSDDHVGYLYETSSTSGFANIIGHGTFAGGAAGYRFDNPDTALADFRLDPATFTGAPGNTYIKASAGVIDINAASNGIEIAVQYDGTERTHTALAAPAPAAPAFTTSSITGTPQDGQTVTATYAATGNPTPTATYQWQRNGTDIAGETGSTLELDAAGDGWVDSDTISCEITLTNSEGSASAEPTRAFTVGGYSYNNTEAETLVNAMTVEPDDTRKGAIDTLVG
ncbi:MAG: hypothetical protein HRT64_14830, partial [Erythrobacter sp.]|nr:hypothetical protein [Erythrobacter sp.]